nr:MAG TPA_asm: RING domain protein [Caudoviricetes sp.]
MPVIFCNKGNNIYLCGERVKMHATYIYDERTYPYCIKPRACCGLVSVTGSFFCFV